MIGNLVGGLLGGGGGGGIGNLLGGLFGGGGEGGGGGLFDGIKGLLGGLGDIANSPLGTMISAIFPPSIPFVGAASLLGSVFGDTAAQVGGGENY